MYDCAAATPASNTSMPAVSGLSDMSNSGPSKPWHFSRHTHALGRRCRLAVVEKASFTCSGAWVHALLTETSTTWLLLRVTSHTINAYRSIASSTASDSVFGLLQPHPFLLVSLLASTVSISTTISRSISTKRRKHPWGRCVSTKPITRVPRFACVGPFAVLVDLSNFFFWISC